MLKQFHCFVSNIYMLINLKWQEFPSQLKQKPRSIFSKHPWLYYLQLLKDAKTDVKRKRLLNFFKFRKKVFS